MMGWGVAAVLMVERGLSWWQVAVLIIAGMLGEFFGNALYDGIKRGRQEATDKDKAAPDRGRAAAGR